MSVNIRQRAEDDLEDIFGALSPQAAQRFTDRFSEILGMLGEHPRLGRARTESAFADLRSFPCDSYMIYYIPHEGMIDVVRVTHSSFDPFR